VEAPARAGGSSALVARDFVASVLRARRLSAPGDCPRPETVRAQRLEALVDTATLCTSELVTSACVDSRPGSREGRRRLGVMAVGGVGADTWHRVRRRRQPAGDDDNPPVVRELTPEGWEQCGRGLHLVGALTDGRRATVPATTPQGAAGPLGHCPGDDPAGRRPGGSRRGQGRVVGPARARCLRNLRRSSRPAAHSPPFATPAALLSATTRARQFLTPRERQG
jgi:hypothetical protein